MHPSSLSCLPPASLCLHGNISCRQMQALIACYLPPCRMGHLQFHLWRVYLYQAMSGRSHGQQVQAIATKRCLETQSYLSLGCGAQVICQPSTGVAASCCY